MEKFSYPFAAVVGQASMKQALLLCAVNPRIGGALLSGGKGTAKSTLIRALAPLLPGPFVELPLNVTEDRLVGAVELERTIRTGTPTFAPGLLQAAHGGVLYADEVNLLPPQITATLLEVAATGWNRVEREGLSLGHRADFVLLGSMNPEEGTLRSQLLDRFGLYAEAHGTRDPQERCQIMERRLAYEADPMAFCRRWEPETQALRRRIVSAREHLSQVILPEECAAQAARLSAQGCCQGHRAELVLCEAALALAAWEGRCQVTAADIRTCAALALPHRLREAVALEEPPAPAQPTSGDAPAQEPPEPAVPDQLPPLEDGPAAAEEVQAVQPLPEQLLLPVLDRQTMASLGSGKRLKVRTDVSRGRYVRYRQSRGELRDIAVDATLRAAVLSGRNTVQPPDGPRIVVKPPDFRRKIREERTGAVILFVVDASGSMGARKRMGAVKGAVLSLLTDAYQKRDTVGIVAFRGHSAQVLLPFTRSVDLAQKRLTRLATGGRTPLAAGLRLACQLLQANLARSQQPSQLLVLVTDGRANDGAGEDPWQEALAAARQLSALPISSLVLDTEQGYARFGMAETLAQTLGAEHCPLDGITQAEIMRHVGRYLS